MGTLAEQLKHIFKSADADGTGTINKEELSTVMKMLSGGSADIFSDDELAKLFDHIDQDNSGQIKYEEFVDYVAATSDTPGNAAASVPGSALSDEEIAKLAMSRGLAVSQGKKGPPPKQIDPSLCKKISPEEKERMLEVFKKYDKDGSGFIDLVELRHMAGDLGAEISLEEATEAMQQLDKAGNWKCDFDEFVVWWTSNPGLGGYKAIVLEFMKVKLKASQMANKAKRALAKAGREPVNTDEVAIKGSWDLSPGMAGSIPMMSASLSLRKAESGDVPEPRITVQLAAVSEEAAGEASKILDEAIVVFNEAQLMPCTASVSQNGQKVVVTLVANEDMAEELKGEEMQMAISCAENVLKKQEMKISSETDFDAFVRAPHKKLCEQVGGMKLDVDMILGHGSLISALASIEAPKQMQAMALLFGGVEVDVSGGFHRGQAKSVAKRLESDGARDFRDMVKAMNKSPEEIRAFMLEAWVHNDNGDKADAVRLITAVRDLGDKLTGVETITIEGIPGCTMEGVVTLENVNPFPLGAYMMETMCAQSGQSNNNSQPARPQKKISQEERERLMEVFKKHDKDGSGAIDLQELQQMCEELGGKISAEESQEAMKQLDKDKSGTCNFEEFVGFWTSKSGLGGYNSAALQFIKLKMATGGALGKARKYLLASRKGITEECDIPVDGSFEFTPGMVACETKMAVTASVKQVEVSDDIQATATMRLKAKSADEAARVMTVMETFVKDFCPEDFPVRPSFQQEGEIIIVTGSAPKEMLESGFSDEELTAVMLSAVNALKNLELKGVSGTSFDDLLASPGTALSEVIKGVKATGQMLISKSNLKLAGVSLPKKETRSADQGNVAAFCWHAHQSPGGVPAEYRHEDDRNSGNARGNRAILLSGRFSEQGRAEHLQRERGAAHVRRYS
mmetsp:Transcript_30228/g.66089  ORF Transcript_30228/g.66089 Transcript_30228/m.66089 type:complete len:911 (-) Transcript_30228:377-3109(-)